MGITKFSYDLIKRTKLRNLDIKSVCELGSQNDYTTGEEPPPFATKLYEKLGINDYTCIDLAGDNNALKLDLAGGMFTGVGKLFDLVTDIGTSEHVVEMTQYETTIFGGHISSIYPKGEIKSIERGYYNCWLNKFNLCKIGGFIISENPLTNNWPGHGYSYLDINFYDELCKIADLEIIEQGLEPAMGNNTDGWNIWSVLKKTDYHFPTFEEFNKLPVYRQ